VSSHGGSFPGPPWVRRYQTKRSAESKAAPGTPTKGRIEQHLAGAPRRGARPSTASMLQEPGGLRLVVL